MSNSPLVNYTKISPNKGNTVEVNGKKVLKPERTHAIDTITIHCVVGQCSVETLGNVFAPTSRQASSNYGVGYDGRIGMYCEEKDRSWCSSSAANDNRAITIEVASDTKHPYAVNDKAFAALLDLVTDICKRNGIKKLVWSNDKNSRVNHLNGCNMTVHRDYANKSCPGEYLYSRHGAIAEEVNKRLAGGNDTHDSGNNAKVLYRVQTGAFKQKGNADTLAAKLKAAGFDTYIVTVNGLYKVQVGAYSVKANAEAMSAKLKNAGYDNFITTNSGTATGAATQQQTPAKTIKVGSTVKLKKGAKTYNGGRLASFVYSRNHIVKQISGDRVVITYGGVVIAAVKLGDLELIS